MYTSGDTPKKKIQPSFHQARVFYISPRMRIPPRSLRFSMPNLRCELGFSRTTNRGKPSKDELLRTTAGFGGRTQEKWTNSHHGAVGSSKTRYLTAKATFLCEWLEHLGNASLSFAHAAFLCARQAAPFGTGIQHPYC